MLYLKTAPAKEPISLLEAKEHLRVDLSDADGIIMAYIKAAREYCEGFQNRSFINRTYELWLDEFPCDDEIKLPMPPLVSVTSVEYYDTVNTKFTMAAGDYFVAAKSEPGCVALAYGKSWPSITLRDNEAVCITYVAGYGSTVASVPSAVKQSILLLLGDYYNKREASTASETSSGNASPDTIRAVERLLWLNRSF
jgi:uncharacterized phiE125 gp8 family phage protein